MRQHLKKLLSLVFILIFAAALVPAGYSRMKEKWRQVSGTRAPDSDLEEEATSPPEAQKEEVVINGKTMVRSRNPYYLTLPNEPEYIYTEKGKELKTLQSLIEGSIARRLGLTKKTEVSKGVPEEEVQERVRKEVDRLLREQGLQALYSHGQGRPSKVIGRYVAVYPNPENARSMDGQNHTLAEDIVAQLSRLKDVKVVGPDKVRAELSKAQATGAVNQRQTLQTLGDTAGVQGLILTGVVPTSGKNPSFLVLEVYETFKGTKVDSFAYPVEGNPNADTIEKFVRNNALRLAGALTQVDWFGRVEFVKEGNVYLSLGDSTGLKVGDRLKVVTPGKEVVNPNTHASLGFSGDESHGELKITELLGNSGAVAQTLSGGPFKANDKVKALGY
jgi:hypothetical protein